MKTLHHLLLALATGLCLAKTASGHDVHIGISPFLTSAERTVVTQQLPAWLIKDAPAGTRVVIWDAWHLTAVVDFTLPKLAVDTPQSRLPRLAQPVADLGRWLKRSAASADPLAGSAALRAPEWLFEAGATATASPRTFILVGSPLYRSPAEPAFDMGIDRYPSDGHLALGLSESVFGLAEKAGRLERATVQWCYAGQSVWANELHRHSVTRFWALFCQGQGGTLATFGSDFRAALSRALQPGLPSVLRVQADPADAKPLMRSARPRSLPLWLETPAAPPAPAAVVAPVAPTPEPEPTPAPVAPPTPAPAVVEAVTPPAALPPPAPEVVVPVVAPEPVLVSMPVGFDSTKTGLGIAWSAASVDLDLHVLLRPGVRELYYRQDRSPEGFLYKDERKANAGRQYEFVEFNSPGPIDLSRATVWVHFYGGKAQDVTGQVVLFERGQVRVGNFALRASRGNGQDSTTQRATSPYWVEIHLADLVQSAAPLLAAKPTQK